MATWDEVKNWIETLGIEHAETDDGDMIQTLHNLKRRGRSQKVTVRKNDIFKNDPWCEFLSEVGYIDDDDLEEALEFLFQYPCGGLIKLGDNYFVRTSLPLANIQKEEFMNLMANIAFVADLLEKQFIGDDEN